MNHLELIQHLKLLVTVNPTECILSKSIGIPLYISIVAQLHGMIGLFNLMTYNFSSQKDEVIDCITSAVDKKAFDSGNITGSMLKEILQEHKNNLEIKMSELNDVWKETFTE